ncbi:serine/threonine-protein kinase [Streptomyces sp. NPDC004111]|uniref:serine/threonine-protein kinase n=1 Tax=Streptomyces sp. NPDC004111 TaxID=3364690 RepID=UPI00367391B4
MCAALDAAHRNGITHRDIKPANILLEEDRVVLTDFGISALEGDATLTATGMIMGTPAFMAPEQVRGLPATAEPDLWSLGATLYAAVEGHAPFAGTAPSAVLVAVATEEPAPTVRADALGTAIQGLLRKDPTARSTVGQVLAELDQVAVDPSTPSAAEAVRPGHVMAPSWSPTALDRGHASAGGHAAPTQTTPPPKPTHAPTAPAPVRGTHIPPWRILRVVLSLLTAVTALLLADPALEEAFGIAWTDNIRPHAVAVTVLGVALALPVAHRAHARPGPYFTVLPVLAALGNIIMLLWHLRIGRISDIRMHVTKTGWWPFQETAAVSSLGWGCRNLLLAA